MRKATTLIALLLCSLYSLHAQTVSDLFQARPGLSRSYSTIVSKYQSLQINPGRLSGLHREAPATLQLELPFEQKQLKLNLKKVKITTDNFSVVEALPGGGRRTVDYNDGVFYHGKIEGSTSSFATISIVGDQVMGIIADDQSNIILGAIEEDGKATSEYTMYRDKDMKVANPTKCFTDDVPVNGPVSPAPQARGNAVGEPVEVYFECDFKLYQDKSSNTVNVINYVLGFFNNTAMLYDNEDIKIQVSQILVWTTQDPEAAAGLNTTSAALTSFTNRMEGSSYIGDYAHFLSRRSLGGGIAWVLGNPCSTERKYRSAVSAIDNNYLAFPTYSWTVQVVTHELGHNFGSNHTQWCGWSGGALDNCVATEPFPTGTAACPGGPAPVNGGTIMSYCHLTGAGINFNNGFGTQPGDRIRAVVNGATCFATCRMTVQVSKIDASCNQSNGSATVTTADGTGTITYLWSNGQTGATLVNAAPGTYHVTVKDGAGCQVMEDIVIGNSGSALSFTLTPAGSAAFCAGNSVTLVATNNPNYTYQWSLDGNPINGATSSSYAASSVGLYSVRAVSGACSGTLSTQVVQVSTPVASITAGGATTVCSGTAVTLNATTGSGLTYQWYNDGTAINGATNSSYDATATGNYTVRVSAGATCFSTSSATAVTVNPSPAANVTVTGQPSFCEGGSVLLTASSGTNYTYQWFRNGNLITGATANTYSATAGGSYTVTTAVGSCSKTSTATSITVLPRPVVVVTPTNSTIEKFQSQTLNATGANLYNWSSLPDMVSSTATTGTYRPLTTTNYAVEGTASNGCKAVANATITVIGCGPVTNIVTESYSPSRVLVSWTNPVDVTSDTLQYRKVGETVWNKLFVTGTSFELTGLEPGADYEYNVIPLCSSTNTFVASAVQAIRTAALQNGQFVRLFPNPVSGTARLEVIVNTAFTLQTSIHDNTGKLIWQGGSMQSLPPGQIINPIDGARLANGVYLVSVVINGKKETIKMVVAH